tara:strand:+ start:2775 stop:2981 length:207 start_codon:yes stop_codon:yes gene_type:complete
MSSDLELFDQDEFDKRLTLAAIVATYNIGYEENMLDLQQDAATTFCSLFHFLDPKEFSALGIELNNSW